MTSLDNKTIFITGATSGFGRALACMCAERGAKVVASGRRADRLAELKHEHPSIETLMFDVRDRDAVNASCKDMHVDALVNNAGLSQGLSSYDQLSYEEESRMVETNINGLLYVTQALLPGMVARNSGHIINISSVAGNYPYPGGNVYGATKAFVTQFSLNLRADLLGKNIRVTNVEPGMAETEFSLVRFAGDRKKADQVYAGVQPLTAEDVARTILWCMEQPPHVNINRVELMPVMQAFSPFAVSRTS
jgi:3-hydroxy acid dehydrogenase/malonic semialdehyde reductase